jgi:hypothetical protein
VPASARLEELLRHERSLPNGATEMLVQQLAAIEAIEAKLGSPGIPPEEFEELVRSCHRLINEAQKLHLASHLRHASRSPF